jgi:D-beta-D-heptose 7-phosphate kinase/D-beta-D-heptose 1-phosphate adenosyltransferase
MKPKILVIGDAMYDRYYIGTTTRISPEAPIPVVKVIEQKFFGGGALNVQANLRELGAEVRVEYGWNSSEGTIIRVPHKNRLMVGTQQVARWDEFDEVEPIELERLDQAVLHWKPDAIVVSDYGKGSIQFDVIEWVEQQKLPTFVDTKRSPKEFGYSATCVFFPNETEHIQWEQQYDWCQKVVLKRSAAGIRRLELGSVVEEYPAWAKQVVSVCGAGDTVLAAYSYASCVGLHALPFANAAAAVVVEKPWTATATVEEVMAKAKEVAECQATKVG